MLTPYKQTVLAAKITDILPGSPGGMSWVDCGDDRFEISTDWLSRYQPKVGGYFVVESHNVRYSKEVPVISNGDAHYSPASVFETKFYIDGEYGIL